MGIMICWINEYYTFYNGRPSSMFLVRIQCLHSSVFSMDFECLIRKSNTSFAFQSIRNTSRIGQARRRTLQTGSSLLRLARKAKQQTASSKSAKYPKVQIQINLNHRTTLK